MFSKLLIALCIYRSFSDRADRKLDISSISAICIGKDSIAFLKIIYTGIQFKLMAETSNESITELTPVANAENNGENPLANGSNPIAGDGSGDFGGGIFGDPLAPDEGYEYDFGEDSGLPMQTPFDQLLEFEEFDNLGDIFGDVNLSNNSFASGTVPEGNSNSSFGSFNPNTDGSPSIGSDGAEETPFAGGSSMMNANFQGMDTGVGNTDNGNGNNFLGDSEGNSGSNNQADGNGNWFYGNDNLAEGNGNWSFGDGNQVNGNGNWNLNEEGGTPFDSIFAGENNPFSGGNPLGVGEESGTSTDAFGGNNPIFAGGSTTPTPVGEGETPDTAENPTGNQNTVNGNGNWNFSSNNDTSGNGNWNFGDGNVVTEGNANWNIGDNNEVSGNGNRPNGNDNTISGNSNRVTGDGNSINGNRLELDESDLDIVGNADRYFQTDANGDVSLVSDESASDSNYTFDMDGVDGSLMDGEVEELPFGSELPIDGNNSAGDIIERVDDSSTEMSTDFLTDSGEENDASADSENPFDGSTDSAGGSPFGGNAPNSNPNSDYDFSSLEQSSEGDPNELIRQSPFGTLLDLPGIDGAEDIFGNVGGGGFGSSDSAGGGNPFSGFGGSDSAGGGNPFSGGFGSSDSAGGGNPFSGGFGSSDSAGGGNPFSGGFGSSDSAGGGNPFSGGFGSSDSAGGGNPFSGFGNLGMDNAEDNSSSEGFSESADNYNYDYSEVEGQYDFGNFSDGGFGGSDSAGGGNPFGGNPFEFEPTADSADSSNLSAGNTFLEGEVPEGLSNEELAVSSGVADGEDAPAENSSSFEGNSMESDSNYNYNWDFDFAGFDSLDRDSSSRDGGVSELANEELLFDEMDFPNLQANDRENTDASFSEGPVFNTETNELLLPNGVQVNPSNEDGELDILLDAPVFNEEGSEIGNLKISFPEFVEDYYSSVFNSDDMIEVFGSSESAIFSSEISDIEGTNLFGIDTPVLGEDNVLQVPGGFEIDLSGIMGDSVDDSIV